MMVGFHSIEKYYNQIYVSFFKYKLKFIYGNKIQCFQGFSRFCFIQQCVVLLIVIRLPDSKSNPLENPSLKQL